MNVFAWIRIGVPTRLLSRMMATVSPFSVLANPQNVTQ